MNERIKALSNKDIPKSLYRVYECFNDCHDYNPDKCLFEHDDLGKAHEFAYMKWKLSLLERAFTII